MYLVGTDEAGYGPNLGPLVITGTLWRIPAALAAEDLYASLPAIRASTPTHAEADDTLVISDSKQLFSPGGGLAALERGVLSALQVAGAAAGRPETWRTMLVGCDPSCAAPLSTDPWHAAFDCPLPIDASIEAVESAHRLLAAALAAADIQLMAVKSRIVFPARFNARIAACGNKATALSLWTLELVEQLIAPLESKRVLVQCDKHGGRNRYGPLLQQVFPEYLIEVREESKLESVYRWGPVARRVEARFVAKGERFLPSALASMVSKYLRELAMIALNAYWIERVPGLRPTAGYPVDARRFHARIREVQRAEGIDDADLWRMR